MKTELTFARIDLGYYYEIVLRYYHSKKILIIDELETYGFNNMYTDGCYHEVDRREDYSVKDFNTLIKDYLGAGYIIDTMELLPEDDGLLD